LSSERVWYDLGIEDRIGNSKNTTTRTRSHGSARERDAEVRDYIVG